MNEREERDLTHETIGEPICARLLGNAHHTGRTCIVCEVVNEQNELSGMYINVLIDAGVSIQNLCDAGNLRAGDFVMVKRTKFMLGNGYASWRAVAWCNVVPVRSVS